MNILVTFYVVYIEDEENASGVTIAHMFMCKYVENPLSS